MKKAAAIVVAGMVGYFVGFYEMKYRTMKAVCEAMAKEGSKDLSK